MAPTIGIMQGRLSAPLPGRAQYFPVERWEEEFRLAGAIGFDAIEWLVDDQFASGNPLFSAEGRARVLELACGIAIPSVCADCFKTDALISDDVQVHSQAANRLGEVISAAAAIGARTVLIPLLENASLREECARVNATRALEAPLRVAERCGVAIAIESDLPAGTLSSWIRGIGHPSLGVYYDLGNAVANGFSAAAELPTLIDLIRGVHVKDRRPFGGPNVPLGTGAVDFHASFACLANLGYSGPLVLETVRTERFFDEARRHRQFVMEHWP